jgi:hypothetical protein
MQPVDDDNDVVVTHAAKRTKVSDDEDDDDVEERSILMERRLVKRDLLRTLQTLMDELVQRDGETFDAFARRLYDLPSVDQSPSLTRQSVLQARLEKLKRLVACNMLFSANNMLGNHTRDSINNTVLWDRLMRVHLYCYHSLLFNSLATETLQSRGSLPISPEIRYMCYSPFDHLDDDLKPGQHLLLFLLQVAHQNGYRRYGGGVYEQIYVEKEDGTAIPTHAWRQCYDTFVAFIYDNVARSVHFEQWKNLTLGDCASNVDKYLKHSTTDVDFPWLKPNRTITSWRNGIYFADDRRFVRYNDEQSMQYLTSEVVACKYFDLDFYNVEPVNAADDPEWWYSQLPTPHFESILDYQNLPEHAKKMLYVMIGRLIYPVGEHDDFQVALFLKGVAGTGKSTIIELVAQFFEACDVGALSSEVETKFGLAPLVDKFLCVCPEVKENFKLSQADLQTMIAGERMSISKKYKDAATVPRWRVPLFLGGNELANWEDAAGSMARRLVFVQFDRVVEDVDGSLKTKLRDELGVFLRKCNEAYRSFTDLYGDRSIWDVESRDGYFWQTRNRARILMNSVAEFISESGRVELRAGSYISLTTFCELFRQWAKHVGKSLKITRDKWISVFQDYKLKVTEIQVRYVNGAAREDAFIEGLAVKGTDDPQPALL